jgi:16S rRNA (uracil1498-N3)-methyltransferase|tara:strand:+ start:54 stop:776 length:723 start_codon:yes stop_codon:yes gene_type:complete
MSNKLVRLYFPDELKEGNVSRLSKNQSHYLKNVMRVKVGQTISLFNSENGEWDVKIISIEDNLTKFEVKKISRPKNKEINIWLAFSLIKKIPQDIILQKTTEIGVQKFIPLICERSVVREINIERAKKILIESSEQSNRISVPKISELQKIDLFLENFPEDGHLFFCDINGKFSNLKKISNKKNPICILIGPEGDFSETERQLILKKKQTISTSIANNILRAETAAIAATTILSYNLNFK